MFKALLVSFIGLALLTPNVMARELAKIPAPIARIVYEACPDPSAADAVECTDADGSFGEPNTIYLNPEATRTNDLADRFGREHALGHLFAAQRLNDGERNKMKRLLGLPGRVWRSGTGTDGGPSSPSERFADAYAACRLRLDPVTRWISAYDYQPSRHGFHLMCATIARAADID